MQSVVSRLFPLPPSINNHAVLCLVAQSCPTLCDPMDSSPPGSSVRGDSPGKNTEVGSLSLLQGIFPTQGSNPGLPHCRWIPSEPPGKPVKNTKLDKIFTWSILRELGEVGSGEGWVSMWNCNASWKEKKKHVVNSMFSHPSALRNFQGCHMSLEIKPKERTAVLLG